MTCTRSSAAAAGDAALLEKESLTQVADEEASYRLALCPGTCSQLRRVYAALFRGTMALPDCPLQQGDFMVVWKTQAQAQADMAVNMDHALACEDAEDTGVFVLAFPSAVDVRPLSECVRMLPGLSDSDLHVSVNPASEDGMHSDAFLSEAFTADGRPQVQLTGKASALFEPQLCWRMAFCVPASASLGEGLGALHDAGLGQLPETVAIVGCSDGSDWLAWVGCLSALTGTDISEWGSEE